MQPWTLGEPGPRRLPFERPAAVPIPAGAAAPAGLLIACAADCFAPELLEAQLAPGAWLVHRTAGNVVPPYGAGHHVEEELIEEAVAGRGVAAVVVCGHWPCDVAAHLLAPDAPADDVVLRHWLSHAEAARRAVAGRRADAAGRRAAAEHNIVAQLANLRTHPAVAAALHQGRLRLWGWLHDDRAGELFYASQGHDRFDRRVALHPDQNAGLRPEQTRRRQPCPLPPVGDPRRLYLA
jgi:carbonic anhydrase